MENLNLNNGTIISFKPDEEFRRELQKSYEKIKPMTSREFRGWCQEIASMERSLLFPAICAPARTDFMKAAYHLPALGVRA